MYMQASMELGPEDMSLLERCPHFRGCYVQASMSTSLTFAQAQEGYCNRSVCVRVCVFVCVRACVS